VCPPESSDCRWIASDAFIPDTAQDTAHTLADTPTPPSDVPSPPDTSPPDDDASSPAIPCASQIDCAPLALLCSPQGACVSPLDGPCTTLTGSLQQPNVLIIGSLLPTSSPADTPLGTAGLPVEQSIQMAVNEINQGGGLFTGIPLVHIGCDTSADPEAAKAAATYLIDTLGAAAIIGPALSVEYAPVCLDVASPKGALLMSASATSPTLSSLRDDGLCWRTATSDATLLNALAARVASLPDTLPISRTVRILSTPDGFGEAMRDSALSQRWGDAARIDAFTYAPDTPTATLQAQIAQALAADNGRPTTAVILTGSALHPSLLTTYDDAHLAAFPTSPPPRYWITDSANSAEATVLLTLHDHPDLRARVEGVRPSPGLDTAPARGFEARYQAAFGSPPPSPFAAAAYDATYALALTASNLDSQPTTGGALAARLPLLGLPERPLVEVGPDQWVAAQIAFAEAGGLDLQGASGALRFDPLTGDRTPQALTLRLWAPTLDVAGDLTLTDQLAFDGDAWTPLSP
jgi:ABC-type branched-subunit amino acid transport system substrate-binding protein